MSTLYVDNLEPNLGSRVMAAGHVVQVVQSTYATETQSTASSYTDTGLTASITPTNSSSKILVVFSLGGGCGVNNTSSDARGYYKLVRDSTDLYEMDIRSYDYGNSGSIQWGAYGQSYLDSPATSSSVTYKIQQKIGTGTIRVCNGNMQIQMQLLEIAQ